MAAFGEIEPVDAAIHADTTHEMQWTYAFAERWTPWLEERGVRVVTVTSGVYDKWMTSRRLSGYGSPPLYTRNDTDGQMRRSCTQRWKVAPIRRWLQANRNKQQVIQLIGISLDEWQRAKDSDVKYITNEWPLIDKGMTRNDCINWLERHGLEVPGKSSCTFCPYHSKRAWQELKRQGGSDWDEAVRVDKAVRKARPPYDLYVHPARIPLIDVDLSTAEDRGQMPLWQQGCDSGACWN